MSVDIREWPGRHQAEPILTEVGQLAVLVLSVAACTFLWKVPWQGWLDEWPWVRVLLSITTLVLPGVSLEALLRRGDLVPDGFTGRVTVGFSASVALTGVLGMVARVAHLSLNFVTTGLFVLSALCLACSVAKAKQSPIGWAPSLRLNRDWVVTAAVLVGAMVLAGRLSLSPIIKSDDYTDIAIATTYQKAERLDIESFGFLTGSAPTVPLRYWIAYFPVTLAVIAEQAGMSAMELMSVYLPPFLAAFSLMAVFSLARALGLSRRLSELSAVSHLASLLLLITPDQPGQVFFERLVQDKVVAAFVLAPIVFRLVVDFVGAPSRPLWVLMSLGVGSLMFTHPTILAVTCLIAGLFALLTLMTHGGRGAFAALLLVLVTSVAIPLSLRFADVGEPQRFPFTVEEAIRRNELYPFRAKRLTFEVDGRLRGLNPQLLNGLPFLFAAAGGAVALFRIKEGAAARYTVAALAPVLATSLPGTSWLLGLAITPFHLWRVLWLTPFGVATGFLIGSVLRLLARFSTHAAGPTARARSIFQANSPAVLVTSLAVLFGSAGSLAHGTAALESLDLPSNWTSVVFTDRARCLATHDDFTRMGQWLDSFIFGKTTVIGDVSTNELLPSVSPKARLVFFRAPQQTAYWLGSSTYDPGERRRLVWRAMVHPGTSLDERVRLFLTYRVRFILLCGVPSWAKELEERFPSGVRMVARSGRLQLYAITTSFRWPD